MKLLKIWGIVLFAISVIAFLTAPSFAYQSAGRAAMYCFSGSGLLLSITVFVIAFAMKKAAPKE